MSESYVTIEVDFNYMSGGALNVPSERVPPAVAMSGRKLLLLDSDGELTAMATVHSYHRMPSGWGYWEIEVDTSTFRDWKQQ